MSRPAITVGSLDANAPGADELNIPASLEDYALAVETLANNLAVLVIGDIWPEVEVWASGLNGAVRPTLGESVH